MLLFIRTPSVILEAIIKVMQHLGSFAISVASLVTLYISSNTQHAPISTSLPPPRTSSQPSFVNITPLKPSLRISLPTSLSRQNIGIVGGCSVGGGWGCMYQRPAFIPCDTHTLIHKHTHSHTHIIILCGDLSRRVG